MWHGEILEPAEVEQRIGNALKDRMAELNGGASHYDCLNGDQVMVAVGLRVTFTWIQVEKKAPQEGTE